MKIRTGFVSNSSSSSFILVLDKKPESVEELAEVMGDCETSDYWGNTLSSEMIADIVFRDINVSDATWEDVESEYKESVMEYNWNLSYGSVEYDTHIKEQEEKADRLWEEFKEKNSEKYVTVVNYEDGSTIGSMMEHGEVFRNIESYIISHH
jgi:hypothetical protein